MQQSFEWSKDQSKAWAKYQHAVKTQTYQDTIRSQTYRTKELENTIDDFSHLIVAEVKSHLEMSLANKLSHEIIQKIEKAVIVSGLRNETEIITLQFAASDLRFKSPSEWEAMILDRYKHWFAKEAKFSIAPVLTDKSEARIYAIEVPRLIYKIVEEII